MAFDWVRRMDIGSYPRVCCGSAHGSVYVADVEANKLLGMAKGVHFSRHNADSSDATHLVDGLDERLRGLLYGEYDGGGVLDVAMHGTNFVASAGREGGVKLFKYIDGSVPNVLEYVGSVPTLIRPLPGTTPTIVTSVRFNSLGQLFVGGNDGYLRMITFPNDFFGMDFEEMKSEVDNMTVTIIKEEEKVQQPPSPILSFD
eukprot:scaffold6344_cov80-Skeletonema_marinoi.AAC.1